VPERQDPLAASVGISLMGISAPAASGATAGGLRGRGATVDESPPRQRDRRYMRLKECEALWAANQSVKHPDVSVPHGWHLNRAKCRFRQHRRWGRG
jgi:hypothetical protein